MTPAAKPPLFDPWEVERAWRLLIQPGQVTELRALDAGLSGDRRPGTVSGYFDDPAKLVTALATIREAHGIYITPNPVDPRLLARAANRIRLAGKNDPTTADANIVGRRWLLIDADPQRPAGISANESEHAAALAVATDVDAWLADRKWPSGILADSGNGGHVMYLVDLPRDDTGLIERCLKALAKQFDNEAVKIDTGVFNPARIWKLYGTLAGKGDSIPDRPHRMARIINAPEALQSVPRELLEALAAEAPRDEKQQPHSGQAAQHNAHHGKFDLERWIAEHRLDVRCPKPWNGGRLWEFNVCPWNAEHTNKSAFIVQGADDKIGAGCHHNGCAEKDWHALRDMVQPGWRDKQRTPATATSRPAQDHRQAVLDPVLVRLADVQPEPIKWLWPGRIALGKLTLLAGDPGLGKSFLSLDLAARVSLGSAWPDDPLSYAPCGGVVLLSAEDDLADTVRPRLDAAGADVSQIVALNGVRAKDGDGTYERCFDLARDLPALETAVQRMSDCRLVVIDPISAFLGATDSHKNGEVRALLAPLGELAARHGVAVVAVTHLSKNAAAGAMYRAMGSLAFIAAARAAWIVTRDKSDPARRLFLPLKNNIAADQAGLAFRVSGQHGDGAPIVEWEPDPVSLSVDEALATDREGTNYGEQQDAAVWLADVLADGPVPTKDIQRMARDTGHAWATVRRAQVALAVAAAKIGFGPGAKWEWSLPAPKMLTTPEDAQKNLLSAFGQSEHLRNADAPDLEALAWQ